MPELGLCHKRFKKMITSRLRLLFSDEEDSEDLACNTRPNESSDDVVKMYNLDGYDDSDANTSVEGGKNLLETVFHLPSPQKWNC